MNSFLRNNTKIDIPIVIGEEAVTYLNNLLSKKTYTKVAILVDDNTKAHCLSRLRKQSPKTVEAEIICIPPGEQNKNIETLYKILSCMLEIGFDRNSLLINLGGGVITDIGGLAASLFQRGIDYINIPTTLLAQVDASIGSKVGINIGMYKNQAGLFSPAKAVFIHLEQLKSLPTRELNSGKAEIIKHSLLSGTLEWSRLFNEEFKNREVANSWWQTTIEKSVSFKENIVQDDPEEKESRKALNFAHTIGHAIESFSLKNDNIPLLHGEAIAIGLVCESYISSHYVGLDKLILNDVTSMVQGLYDYYPIKTELIENLLSIIKKDKKRKGNDTNFTLIKEPGIIQINQNPPDKLISDSLIFYKNQAPTQ